MPLPPPVAREDSHRRDIVMHGYRRADGLFDIEGRLTDRRSKGLMLKTGVLVAPDTPVHDMSIRLTIDIDYIVREVHASSDSTPYDVCRSAPPELQKLIGSTMSIGWTRAVRSKLGGDACCTHLVALLLDMGTVAFQTLVHFRHDEPDPESGSKLLNTCVAYSEKSPIVQMIWPKHYKSPSAIDTTEHHAPPSTSE